MKLAGGGLVFFILGSLCLFINSVVRKNKPTSHWLADVKYFYMKLLHAITSLQIKLET